MVNTPLVKFDLVKVMLGSVSWRSDALSICCAARLCAVKALTAIGTSCRLCDWRCAVTTISSIWLSSFCGVVLAVVAGWSCGGAVCAAAGVAAISAMADAARSSNFFMSNIPSADAPIFCR